MLGAMLPDFASMSRARLFGAEDAVVAAGIALHHATDDAFHGGALLPRAVRARRGGPRGGRRGPGATRAVAHVGTELLLDGLLLDDPEAARCYRAAVALPREPLGLRFPRGGAARFAALDARLREHDLPEDYRSPERVALRLEQILARRPRLALAPGERPAVVAYLERTQGALVHAAPRLMAEVRRGLESAGFSGAPARLTA
ncbi:MAG: hypothetical protein M5U28_34970 [Sandaracinaceae bacterium]|nr:hypothetical protein [Sandaracinaceae bacterium]